MADPKSWRKAYESVRRELNPAKQLQLCAQARRLMQERLVELSTKPSDAAEVKDVEESLRALWKMEKDIRKPPIQ